nr:recombinase family protein [Planobispora longispora]
MISPELQAHEQDTYAERNGIRIVERVEDLDLSGRDFARRSVDYIVKGIIEGRWNVVLLWKWSRWGRNLLQSRLYLAEVEQAGGEVIAVTEDFDTTTSVGKFSRDQMLAIAELQSNQIGENWKEAHERRRRMGLPHNGQFRFGYTYSRGAGYQPDPVSADALADCYKRYVEAGESMRSLTQMLNANGHRTGRGNLFTNISLGRLMDTGFAAGLIREKSNPGGNGNTLAAYDVWRMGVHEPIISMELWEKYREKRLASAETAPRLRSPKHSFSGLVYCPQCKKRMRRTTGGGRNGPHWRCRTRLQNKSCPGASIMDDRLEKIMREWVVENAQGGDTIEEDADRIRAAQKATTNLAACEAEVARLKRKRTRLLDVYTDDESYDKGDYLKKKAEIDRDLERADLTLRAARKRVNEIDTTDYRDIFTTLADLWDNATPSEKRELLSKVVRRIEVRAGTEKRKLSKVNVVPRWMPDPWE